jgi:drug/metabolite transporter (DMT)-like permease
MSVLLIQRMYIFGLKKADPFISAMTLCTIVPLSLAMDILFEHRPFGLTEIALAIGYMLTMALNVNSQAELRPIE